MGSGLFAVLAGVFCIVCSALDMEWFLNSGKSRIWVKLLGRNGARIFYICLGIFLVIAGIMLMFVGG